MELTKEQLAKAKEAKTLEELTALAKAEGVEAPAEDVEKLWNALHAEGELADEELNNVSGGCGYYYLAENTRIQSSDPRCYMCGERLKYVEGGIHEVEFEGRMYLCDEFKCDYWRCDNCSSYLHLWEGDRWLTREYSLISVD